MGECCSVTGLPGLLWIKGHENIKCRIVIVTFVQSKYEASIASYKKKLGLYILKCFIMLCILLVLLSGS